MLLLEIVIYGPIFMVIIFMVHPFYGIKTAIKKSILQPFYGLLQSFSIEISPTLVCCGCLWCNKVADSQRRIETASSLFFCSKNVC